MPFSLRSTGYLQHKLMKLQSQFPHQQFWIFHLKEFSVSFVWFVAEFCIVFFPCLAPSKSVPNPFRLFFIFHGENYTRWMLLRVNYFILFLPASSFISILFKLIQITRHRQKRKREEKLKTSLRVCSLMMRIHEKNRKTFSLLKTWAFFTMTK